MANSLEVRNERDVGTRHCERVARRCADHLPRVGPMDEGMPRFGVRRHSVGTALCECAAAVDGAVSGW
jgi:hypothetical protein